MPIYEYACECGRVFEEVLVRKSDEAEVTCPDCRTGRVTRLMSRPADARTGAAAPRPPSGGRCGPVG